MSLAAAGWLWASSLTGPTPTPAADDAVSAAQDLRRSVYSSARARDQLVATWLGDQGPSDLGENLAPVPRPPGIQRPAAPPLVDPDVLAEFSPAERMSVRVRAIGCTNVETATGFALGPGLFVTNKHAIEDATQIELTTFSGDDLIVDSVVAIDEADLALVRTTPAHLVGGAFVESAEPSDVAVLAESPARVGEHLSVVGYPDGGPLATVRGRIVRDLADPLGRQDAPVQLLDATVRAGSSGSAAVNDVGEVVGVIYAKNAANHAFMLSVTELRAALESTPPARIAPLCR